MVGIAGSIAGSLASSAVGSVLGKNKKQQSAVTGSTQQTNGPPEYLLPYLEDITGKAKSAYDEFIRGGYNQPYAGQRTAYKTPYDQAAEDYGFFTTQQYANNGGAQPIYDLGAYLGNKVTNQGYMAPGNMAFDSGDNDSTVAAIMAKTRPIINNFSESIVPKLKSSAIDAGAYGGSKSQDLGARVARDTQTQIGDLAAELSYQDFMQRRQIDQQDLAQRRNLLATGNQQEIAAGTAAAGLRESALNSGIKLSDLYSNIGGSIRGFDQQILNDNMARYAELQKSPFAGLEEYANIIYGQNRGGTQNSTTRGYSRPGQNWLTGLGAIGEIPGLLNQASAYATGLPWLASGGFGGLGNSWDAFSNLF